MIKLPVKNRFGKQKFTLIDDEDLIKVGDRKWAVSEYGYVINRRGGKSIRIHRVILGSKPGEVSDHINRDKLDNRKSNLRICSHSENGYNKNFKNYKKKYPKLPMYITYEKSRKKYVAGVRKDRRRFSTLKEAKIYLRKLLKT